MPVHTVGVGAETMPNDLELEDVQLPSVGLPGSTVSAQISIRHSGATLAQLKVYDGDAILASEAIQLPATTGVTTRWVDIDVGAAGVRDLKFALDAHARRDQRHQQLAPAADGSARAAATHLIYRG